MNTQIRAIVLMCILAGTSTANVVLEGVGADDISGYIVSPVIGISRIHLHRKFRRQVNLHIPLIPYVEEPKKLSSVVARSVPEDGDDDPEKSPMSESFFQFDDDEE